MTPLSTPQVARLVGVHTTTLERWLAAGKILRPKTVYAGKRAVRFWTGENIQQVKRYKEKFYRKGRGRKKQDK